MVSSLRERFNAAFSPEAYQAFMQALDAEFDYHIRFRVAETPVFVPAAFRRRLLEAAEGIIDVLCRPDFKALSESAIPDAFRVPREDAHTTFLCLDFAVCRDEAGELSPQLIELQGCPSLFAYQVMLAETYRRHYPAVPPELPFLFGGLDHAAYFELLRRVIVADENPEQVILLEVDPDNQATRIDFLCTERELGIRTVCTSDLRRRGRQVYYERDGKEIPVRRIYNRVIFDDYVQRTDKQAPFAFTEDLDVTWVGHPNWFFRISKHTMPLLKSPYVPETLYLHELREIPPDLDRYVLKPLFSYAGSGVKIHVTPEDLAAVDDPSNYILQRKVEYAPVIPTPDDPAKVEIRLLYVWEPEAARPRLVVNLARLSKGLMIGVRYNKDREWVGGSVCFFE
ncbi:MAG: hypothetical protein NW241_07670 [Bacteroidia bacterium]|nr:hypothetical protein [Bacteroidia bacterium]